MSFITGNQEEVRRLFLKMADETFRFEYQMGEISPVPMGASTGWRTLPCLLTVQVRKGRMLIQRNGQKDQILKEDEATCVPAGVLHKIDLITSRPAISIWAHVNFWIFDRVDMISLLEMPTTFSKEDGRRIGEINEELSGFYKLASLSLRQIFRKRALGSLLFSILVESSTLHSQSLKLFQLTRRLVPVLAFIQDHLESPLRHGDLAKMASLSPSRFHDLFRAALGISPGKYVQNLRIQRARHLLISSDLSVQEISQKVGHPDPFHFSRIFKKHLRWSPHHYRMKAQKGTSGM